ncbi:MAG: NlpC/P60 family protein [Microcystaceae cyanobacterium]
MITLDQFVASSCGEYTNSIDLNLYDSPECNSLATQARKGRHWKPHLSNSVEQAIEMYLCEDDYQAWLPLASLNALKPASKAYQPTQRTRQEIEAKIPQIIAFTKAAMACPNYYLWGGTVGPNYDCSGLIQAAFEASGIWLPRDSYQQEAFTQRIEKEELSAGDLIFFGNKRVDHVALYLGDGHYIHSSGPQEGRNKIAIDPLSLDGDRITQHYYHKLWSFGRVMESYFSDQ